MSESILMVYIFVYRKWDITVKTGAVYVYSKGGPVCIAVYHFYLFHSTVYLSSAKDEQHKVKFSLL